MRHHAFVIEAQAEEGIAAARDWVVSELKMELRNNPDIVVLRYGLLSVEDARDIYNSALQAPFRGEHKALIIAANRAYHEAQNALLKLFEEPPSGTYLFLVLPTVGGLLPTLRSRVQILKHPSFAKATAGKEARSTKSETSTKYHISQADEFIRASKEKRSALIKKLTSGSDEKERRTNREVAIAIVSGVEAAAYAGGRAIATNRELLKETQTLRGYLHDRSAPLKMILEHLSLVIPKNLL